VNDGGSSDNWATTDVEPRSVADNEPWRYIAFNNNEYDAVEACQTLDSQTNDFDVHLITNREWMTIARQIEQNNANWVDTSDGSDADVGDSGAGIYRGSVGLGTELDVDLSGPQPANVAEEERTLELANGKIIWDLSGNANQWVDVEEDGTYLSKRLVSQGDWDEVEGGMTDPWSMNKGDQSGKQLKYESGPSSISWANRDNGVGFAFEIQDLEYKAARRGGAWTRGDSAGIFLLSALDDSRIPSEYIGFRCSAVPVS